MTKLPSEKERLARMSNAEVVDEYLDTPAIEVQAIARRVIFRPIPIKPIEKQAGIMLPNQNPETKMFHDHPYQGVIVALGEVAVTEFGLKVGDHIYYREMTPYVMMHEETKYFVIDAGDVFCSVTH